MRTKDASIEDKITISVPLPLPLFEKVKHDVALTKKPIGAVVEEWVEQYIDPGEFNLDLETMIGGHGMADHCQRCKGRQAQETVFPFGRL